MSEHQFTADEKSSADFSARLIEYMESNVLQSDKTFICEHEKECRDSCEPGQKFFPGQLHHVGPLYDLKRDGKPFRIMVSGAEYGGDPARCSVKDRTDEINILNPTNLHMKGTRYLLQMLFGKEPRKELEVRINNNQYSIFRVFSLANFLLCSAQRDSCRTQAFTEVTKKNCENHYQKTIEILQPQIIVLQGDRAWNFFRERYNIDLDHKNAKIEKIEVGEKPILVLPLHHPSYLQKAWGRERDEAITTYVKPAVKCLLDEYAKM